MTSKYRPLGRYLESLPSDQDETTLTLSRIEEILGEGLPRSAYQYQAFWANERNPHQPQKQCIQEAGWKVESVNLQQKWVSLQRVQ
jgi:hypothetical protein